MDVSTYKFSEKEIIELKNFRDNQDDPRLKQRFIALLIFAEGLEINKVASIIGKSLKIIKNWLGQYLTKGIESLNSFQYKPKPPLLNNDQIENICNWVRETNPSTLKQIREYIIESFNVTYSIEAVRQLLIKNGLKLLTPITVPGNPPNEEEQIKTIERYFEMKENSEPGAVFLFGDGMHLIHQNVASSCWGDPKNPPVIQTNTGRQRLNILGAYNPDSHKFVHLTGEENCDANRVVEFLEILKKAYGKTPKIILILDNAKYFKAEIDRLPVT